MSPKKIGVKGKAIGSQGREIINNVIKFMQQEAETDVKIPLTQYRKRALAATGISQSTYQKIASEGRKQLYSPSTPFSSPHKKRQRKEPVFEKITPSLSEDIKTILYDFYVLEKRRPTLGCIYQKMKDKQLDFDGKITSLNKLLKRMGFRWRKTTDNKKALIEKFYVRLKRIEFLKQIKKYRAENRYIVYTDDTCIHSSHTESKGWSDDNYNKEPKKPIKGQRLIIVHAGGERGFIPNALLILKSGLKSGNYHGNIDYVSFMKWIKTQLIPNLPERSVLVVNNASYHNVTVEENITSASLKADMMKWLSEHDLEFEEDLTKAELYKKIRDNKFRFPPKYKLDVLMEQHGHCVLRLPPYHPELNPIEEIWALVKKWVASRNVTFRLADVQQLIINKFEEVGVTEWKKICDHVKKYENRQIEKEHLLDNTMDELEFTVNMESSSEEETDSEKDSDLDVNMLSSSDTE